MPTPVLRKTINQDGVAAFLQSLRDQASVYDSILFEGVDFSHCPLRIAGTCFVGFLHFVRCKFHDQSSLTETLVRGGIRFEDCEIEGRLSLRNCHVLNDFEVLGLLEGSDGRLEVVNGEVAGSLTISGTRLSELHVPDIRVLGSVDVSSSMVHGRASFARANIAGGLRFSQNPGNDEPVSVATLDLQSVRVQGNLSLRGIQVMDRLDLHDAEVGGSVHFKPYSDVFVKKAVSCRASVGTLHAPGLKVRHALDLRGLTIAGGAMLDDASVMAIHAGASTVPGKGELDSSWLRFSIAGCLHMGSATVSTDVDLSGAEISGGLYGPNVSVGGAFKLQRREKVRTEIGSSKLLNNAGTEYSVWLVDAKIGAYLSFAGAACEYGVCLDGIVVRGDLYLDSARHGQGGPVRSADSLRLEIHNGSMHPHRRIVRTVVNNAKKSADLFAISMRDASIDGDIHISGLVAGNGDHRPDGRGIFDPEVDFTGTSFRNLYADRECPGEAAPGEGCSTVNLRLQSVEAKGTVILSCLRDGYVYLDQAAVSGSVVFYNQGLDPLPIDKDAKFSNSTEFAEIVDRLVAEHNGEDRYSGGLTLNHVSLRQARIKGDVDLTARILRNGLDAEQISLEGDLFLFGTTLESFSVDYQGSNFSLSLFQGRIGGSLLARGVQAKHGIDLAACEVDGNVDFSVAQRRFMLASRIGVTHLSRTTWPVNCCLWMRAARIGGKLLLQGATLEGGLSLIDASVGGVIDLSSSYRMTDPEHDVTTPMKSVDAIMVRTTVIGRSKYRPDEEDFSLDLRNSKISNFIRIDNSTVDEQTPWSKVFSKPEKELEGELLKRKRLLAMRASDREYLGPIARVPPKERADDGCGELIRKICDGLWPERSRRTPVYTTIESDINMSGAEIGGLHIKGLVFRGTLRARQMRCSGGFDLIRILGQGYFLEASGSQGPKKAQFDFSFSRIEGKLELTECIVGGIQAVSATIMGVCNVTLCLVREAKRRSYRFSIRMTGSDINGHFRVRYSILKSGIALVTTKIRADFHCEGCAVAPGTWQTSPHDTAILAHKAYIGATAILKDSLFTGAVDFSNAEIGKDLVALVHHKSSVSGTGDLFRMSGMKVNGRASFDIETMGLGSVFNYSSIGDFHLESSTLRTIGDSRTEDDKSHGSELKESIFLASGGAFRTWSRARFWIGRPVRKSVRGKITSGRKVSAFGIQWQDFNCKLDLSALHQPRGIRSLLEAVSYLQAKVCSDLACLLTGTALLLAASWTANRGMNGAKHGGLTYAALLVALSALTMSALLLYEIVRLRAAKEDYKSFVGVWVFLESCRFSHGLYLRMADMFAKMGARNYADSVFVRMRRRELDDRDYSGSFARLVYGTITRYGTNTRLFTIVIAWVFAWCMLSLDARSENIYGDLSAQHPREVLTNLLTNSARQVVQPPYSEPTFWKDARSQVRATLPRDGGDGHQSDGAKKGRSASSDPEITGFAILARQPLLLTRGALSVGAGFILLRSLWWLWWVLVIAEVFGLLRKYGTEGMQR